MKDEWEELEDEIARGDGGAANEGGAKPVEDDDYEDDYEDEDFEDYEDEDDFEEYDEEEDTAREQAKAPTPVAPAQPVARPPLPMPSRSPSPPVRKDPMAALADAINAENQAVQYTSRSRAATPVGGRPGSAYHSPSPEPISAPVGRMAIPSSILSERMSIPTMPVGLSDAAKKAADQRRDRWKSLQKEVRLSEVRIDDMFVLEPLTMAQLWSLGRGPYSTMSVKSTQTSDDVRSLEVQTDEVEVRGVAAQAPEDLGVSRQQLEAEADGKRRSKLKSLVKDDTAQALQGSKERRMANFIVRSGMVVDNLLQERSRHSTRIFKATAGSANSVSASSLTLHQQNLLEGRSCVGVAYPAGGGDGMMLTAYSLPEASRGYGGIRAHGMSGMGLLLAWDMSLPQGPSHMLVSEGAVSCCCLGPDKSQLAFGGMEDGGICAWDLREPPSLHKPLSDDTGVYPCRRPTYSTEYDAAAERAGTVVRMAVSSRAGLDSQEHARAFQLISMDNWGRVTVWMVSDMSRVDVAGAQRDYGLRIGGRVKLLKTAENLQTGPMSRGQRRLQAAERELETASTVGEARRDELERLRERVARSRREVDEEAARAFDLRLVPGDPSQFVVAADAGRLLRGARYGSAPPPRSYVLEDGRGGGGAGLGSGGPSAVAGSGSTTCVAFCPHAAFQGMCVAGYSGGSVAVFDLDSALPVAVWRDVSPASILAVAWSPARPAMLFAVDARSTLYAWDLAQPGGALGPVHAESFGAPEGPTRVTAVEVSAPDPSGQPSMALAYEGGLVALHLFSQTCVTPVEGEEAAVRGVLRPSRGVGG